VGREKTSPALKRANARLVRAIKGRLEAKALTPSDVAKRTRWHEQRVWRLLYGHTLLSMVDVAKFADILETTAADLYSEAA
jgi:hypothetical protein